MKKTMRTVLCLAMSMILTVGALPYHIFAEEALFFEAAGPEVLQSEDLQSEDFESETPASEVPESKEEGQGLLEGEVNADAPDAAVPVEPIEVNQGFGLHTKREGGEQTLIREFAAGKQTAVIMKIPGSDTMTQEKAKEAVGKKYFFDATAVVGGKESDDFVICEYLVNLNFKVIKLYDKDCNPESGWYLEFIIQKGLPKGVYNFRILELLNDDTVVTKGESLGISFYETRELNILILPVKAYWGMAVAAPEKGAYSCKDDKFLDYYGNERDWTKLRETVEKYLLDTYPTAKVNVAEGNELDASKMDLCTDKGMRALWKAACKRQGKTNGEDKYDLILAFVRYRQGEKGNIQGYTYTRPANIITYTDGDMLPTIGHEIAHCFEIGDEYNGGTFNPAVNLPPQGYKGSSWDFQSEVKITEGDWQDPEMYVSSTKDKKKGNINIYSSGTMIPLSLHPFSLSNEKIITWDGVDKQGQALVNEKDTVRPTMCFMGSGYNDAVNYWNSSVNWDHLLKSLVKKKSGASKAEDNVSAPDNYTNVDVFNDSICADMASGQDGDDNFIEEDDLYYDDEYRFGEADMIEVSGRIVTGEGAKNVEMAPMFSYRGDLEYIEPLEEGYKDSDDVYTFAALDKDGKIISSPVDGKPAAVEFYAGRYCCSMAGVESKGDFGFDAEYPEGTADFAIMEGRLGDDGSHGQIIWQASTDESFFGDIDLKPEGWLTYSNYDEATGKLMAEWDVEYPEEMASLYSEVYYFPDGDDGDCYYVTSTDEDDWTEGAVVIDTGDYPTACTRNAYVWIKVTNGVNAVDIYSDDNEVTLSNSIIGLSGKGIKAQSVDGKTVYTAEYTGDAITPNTTVKAYDPSTDKYISLKKDVDYSVSYEDSIDIGTARVCVQGIGEYAGKKIQTFEIICKDIDGTPEPIPDMKYTNDLDSAVVPNLVITVKNGSKMVYDEDFSVVYTVDGKTDASLSKLITEDPEVKKEVTVTYTGKGNYSSVLKKKIKFNVLPAGSEVTVLSQENTTITLKADTVDYTGKPVKASIKSVVVKVDGADKTLKSSDYSVVFTNNINLGTARVTVVGKKNYAGSAYKTYTIQAKPVTSLSVKGLADQPYTGKEINVADLPIEVKAGGVTLKKDRDYIVEAVEGCNYREITTAQMKKDKTAPRVRIKLRELSEEELKKTKAADRPIVRWKAGVADSKKTVDKTFSIVATKLNSGAVTVTQKNSDQSMNIVKDKDGKQIGTLISADKIHRKKYAFVIEGEADSLVKNADFKEALAVKANGDELKADTDYVITATAAKDDKIGTITIKAVKNGICTGSRKVKFLYLKKK